MDEGSPFELEDALKGIDVIIPDDNPKIGVIPIESTWSEFRKCQILRWMVLYEQRFIILHFYLLSLNKKRLLFRDSPFLYPNMLTTSLDSAVQPKQGWH